MKNPLKTITKFLFIFLVLTIVQLSLVCLAAIIPSSYIQDNTEKSAKYLTQRSVFFNVNTKDSSSRIDRYADSILLNIAYSHDHTKPLESAMSSSYYFTSYQNENYNLLDNATGNINTSNSCFKPYSRYWHGSNVIIKPLLIFFNVKQIYFLSIIILLILCITLLFSVKKHISSKVFGCLLISMIMVSIWYVPLSLEYTWCFIIMLISSIYIISLYKKKIENAAFMYFIVGSLTCYFDFLTTETITFLIPFIIVLVMKHENNCLESAKNEVTYLFKSGSIWLLGYVLTWLSKWGLASAILKENVFDDALNQASYRISGAANELSGISESLQAVLLNISCIFPFSFIKAGYISVIITLVLLLMMLYVCKKKRTPATFNLMLSLIAVIPLIRFMLLSNHSYVHYFFTYRALMTSILAISLLWAYNFDFNYIKKRIQKK